VVGTEAQLLLAPRLPVLGWVFKEMFTDATWSKWVALITQCARMGNPSCPGILEVIIDWPEGKYFGISPEEEVTGMLKRLHCRINYQQMSSMPCSLMGPVALWENVRGKGGCVESYMTSHRNSYDYFRQFYLPTTL